MEMILKPVGGNGLSASGSVAWANALLTAKEFVSHRGALTRWKRPVEVGTVVP